jgi:glycerol-3-phosphate dehydrogenase (NAD(P)+)
MSPDPCAANQTAAKAAERLDPAAARVAVVGAGSWGTALADLLGRKGYAVDLWVFEPEVREMIALRRENPVFLPGVALSHNLRPSGDLAGVVAGKDLVVVVVPSHVMRVTAAGMAASLAPETRIVSASKGIEEQTQLTMSGVLQQTLPGIDARRLAVLSGPSFAREVARGVPTVVTVASRDAATAQFVQRVFATPSFRVYTGRDLIGVELGGAVKNVVAIAAGIVDGLGLGLNTRAALITRGQTEIRRLGLRLGANPRTFTGLAGMGDLILTCTGDISRNHSVGRQLGEGRRLAEILSGMSMVAEGVKNARAVHDLARRLGVEMPICHAVFRILYEDLSADEALRRLMTRDLKEELDER